MYIDGLVSNWENKFPITILDILFTYTKKNANNFIHNFIYECELHKATIKNSISKHKNVNHKNMFQFFKHAASQQQQLNFAV